MDNEEHKSFSKYDYNPNTFDSPLKDYMINAYTALENNDAFLYRMSCVDITKELKWSWENNIIRQNEANEIRDYFWGMSE